MNTIDKLKSILEESDEQFRDKIKELITEMEKEQPKLLDKGWFYAAAGNLREFSGLFMSTIAERAAIRPNQKEAKYASLVNELWNKRKRAQDILCPGYRFSTSGKNWHTIYSHGSNSWDLDYWTTYECPLVVYFDTKEHALETEEMFDIKDLRERVRTFWD